MRSFCDKVRGMAPIFSGPEGVEVRIDAETSVAITEGPNGRRLSIVIYEESLGGVDEKYLTELRNLVWLWAISQIYSLGDLTVEGEDGRCREVEAGGVFGIEPEDYLNIEVNVAPGY